MKGNGTASPDAGAPKRVAKYVGIIPEEERDAAIQAEADVIQSLLHVDEDTARRHAERRFESHNRIVQLAEKARKSAK